MNKRTKLILTLIGAAALVVPVVLLITFSSGTDQVPPASSDNRSIDSRNVEDAAKRAMPASPSPLVIPSPSPASESAQTPSSSPEPVEQPTQEEPVPPAQ